jgi:hypothetical protein
MINKSEFENWAKNVMNSIEDVPHHLENNTFTTITDSMVRVLVMENVPNIAFNLEKLKDYRYVSDVCDVFRGRHIRWIRIRDNEILKRTLTNGGIVTDIKFLDNGTHIQCKNARNQFIQIKFDDCLLFQKLTAEECLFLMMQSKIQG